MSLSELKKSAPGIGPVLPLDPSSSLPARAWLTVGLLCVVACLNYLDRVMLTTMRESITSAIPMSDAQFGWLTSIFLIVYGVLSPLAGFVSDRFSRSRIIIGSLLLWSAFTWLTAHAANYPQLLVFRALMGVSEACYLPAALALIVDYHRGPTRSLATGVHLCGISIGSALGGMGGWLAENHGWSFAFSLFGSIGIAYAVVLVFALRDVAPPKGQTAAPPHLPQALRSLFGERSYMILLLHWGLMGVAGWGVIGWMPTYLQQQFHLSQGEAGFKATLFLQIATLLGLIVGGAMADRWSRHHPRGRVFIAIVGVCVAAPAIFLTAITPVLAVAIFGLVIFGFARAFTDGNTMPILCLFCDPRYRATGFGILNLVACVVGGLTIVAGGWLRDMHVNVRHLFEFSAVGLLLCAVLLSFIKPASPAKS